MQDNDWQVGTFPSDLDFCWEDFSLRSQTGVHAGTLDDFALLPNGPSPALEWNKGLYLNSAPEIPRAGADAPRPQLQDPPPRPAKQQLYDRVNGKPPPGCETDAMKIFVGNIPTGFTGKDLLPFFETIGKVIDIVVVRDKATRESKGSAFVWYQTRADAENAITQFNMRYILPDPTGKQTRPLALRKAQAAHQPQGPSTPAQLHRTKQWTPPAPRGALPRGEAPLDWLMQDSANQGGQARPVQLPGPSPPTPWGSYHGQHVNVPRAAANPAGGNLDSMLHGCNLSAFPAMDEMHSSAQLMNSLAQAYGMPPQLSTGAARAPPGPARVDNGVDALLGLPGMMQPDSQRSLSAKFAISKEQLVTLSEFMHRVRSVSGAQLHVAPGSCAGVFDLFVLGSQLQVDAARMLLSRILSLVN